MPSAVKEKFVEELSEDLKKTDHVLLTHYQGLNSEELGDLRGSLKKAGAKFKVVKNRLAKIALNKRGWNVDQYLKGPTALTYYGDDIAKIAKILKEFSKKHKNLKIQAGHLFGEVADEKAVIAIADLPSRESLLATLLATMQSPLQKLVATLNEPMRSLHTVLTEAAKKKEAAPAAK